MPPLPQLFPLPVPRGTGRVAPRPDPDPREATRFFAVVQVAFASAEKICDPDELEAREAGVVLVDVRVADVDVVVGDEAVPDLVEVVLPVT